MQEWTGAVRLGDALIMTARRLPETRWLVSTQVRRRAATIAEFACFPCPSCPLERNPGDECPCVDCAVEAPVLERQQVSAVHRPLR